MESYFPLEISPTPYHAREVRLRLSMFSKNAFVTFRVKILTCDLLYLYDNTYDQIF